MSLIPYHPREGREIVLRHRNAIVVRDPDSHRLEIRGLNDCPTCHRPLNRASSPERRFERSYDTNPDTYVDPDYFRMLRAGNHNFIPDHAPPSPVRTFSKPAIASGSTPSSRAGSAPRDLGATPVLDGSEAEFVSSSPGVAQAEGSRIRRDAFSPNYFKTFFVEEKVLGRGGKGVVLLVRHEIDGCLLGHFACKRVPVGDDHAWLEKVLVEVELLAKLSHPNLVSYRHVWLEDMRLTRFGPSVACAFILQQYCNGGDLHQYVLGAAPRETTKEELKAQMRRRSKGQMEMPQDLFSGQPLLSFEEIYSLFKDVTSGVAYLHASNYIHRDLKPSNCLLHREGSTLTCLISDFGEVQPENVVRKSTGSTGTISYCAPEVLTVDPATGQYGNFTTKSDMFSLGMILYFMCFGGLPYRSANAVQEELEDMDLLRAEITDWQGFHDERRERPDLPSKLYTLLKKLLALNPLERPSATEVLNAMRNEGSLDNMGKASRSPGPSLRLHGSRVQSLDSPAGPSTPVPEPRKHQTRARSAMDNGPSAWPNGVVPNASSDADGVFQEQAQSAGLRHRPQSMALSHSRGSYRNSNHSPRKSPVPAHSSDGEGTEENPYPTPLLLAPPLNPSGRLQRSINTVLHLASSHWDAVSYITRLGIFLLKIWSVAHPCWPYMPSQEVGIPLVVLAALDLRSSLSRPYERPQYGEYFPQSRAIRDMKATLLLLVLHGSALWTASHWGGLCVAATQRNWEDW